MSITDNCMVTNLQIGLWSGHRLDREATRKVTEDAGAESDAARVNKHLVPKSALKDVVSTSNAIRLHFYGHTLPWKDNGDRLLSRVMYARFIEDHESLVATFNHAVRKFVTEKYPEAVEQAGFRMGELFDISDYPTPAAIERKFYVNLDIDPVTSAGDFRVQMDKDELASIQKSIESATEKRIATAMHDAWKRLADVVGHFADRMDDSDKIFRKATLANLEELVDILPGLNITADPELERIGREVKAKLCGLDAEAIRNDAQHRKELADDAKAIMDQMGSFMAAFGGDR